MSKTIEADRCRGVLIGLAAGDRIGGPIRMAVRLAESLLDCGGFATQHIIRHGEYDDTMKISRLLLGDREDLIHKAVGWMLREVGKKHEPTLVSFLVKHGADMPRIMLRYAIERFSPEKRCRFLAATSTGEKN